MHHNKIGEATVALSKSKPTSLVLDDLNLNEPARSRVDEVQAQAQKRCTEPFVELTQLTHGIICNVFTHKNKREHIGEVRIPNSQFAIMPAA